MLRTGIGVILGASWCNVAMGYSPNEKQLVITAVCLYFPLACMKGGAT